MHPIEHFKTITRHRHLVCRYCFRLGLWGQGLTHDLSKYSPTEFLPGARYWQGTRSPNDVERRRTGVSLAWLHHKGRNRHHFEYWIDYVIRDDGRVEYGGNKMPLRFVAEMFCDRVAASKIYQKEKYTDKSPLEYFINGKHRRMGMIHPATSDLIEDYLTHLFHIHSVLDSHSEREELI